MASASPFVVEDIFRVQDKDKDGKKFPNGEKKADLHIARIAYSIGAYESTRDPVTMHSLSVDF